MEDINISGADFGTNLPKWATDETLKRLLSVIEKDNTHDKRHQQKLITLLGKMLSATNAEKTANNTIISELKSISKELRSNNNKSSNTTQQPSKHVPNSHEKKVEQLLKNVNATLAGIDKKTSPEPTQIKTTSGNANPTTHTNTVTEKETIREVNNNLGDHSAFIEVLRNGFNMAVDSTKQQTKTLGDILSKNSPNIGKGSIGERVEREKARIAEMSKSLEGQLNSTGSILGTNNKRVAATTATLGKSLGYVAKTTMSLGKLMPVIGTVVAGLSSLSAIVGVVVNTTKKYSWDAQREFKAMLNNGFGFGIETIEQGIQMDAIRLHGMINRSGLIISEGIALMEKNAVLMNNIGTDSIFQTIANVADQTNKNGVTFQNQLMLSRQEIGEFTTQFLASSMNLINTERLREENRTKAAQQYIKDARLFGQVTGQGMQVIIDRMNTLRQSNDYRLGMASRGESHQALTESTLSMFNSMNVSSSITDLLNKTILSGRGIGLAEQEGGSELRLSLDRLVSGLGTEFDTLIRQIQSGDMTEDERNSVMADLVALTKEATENGKFNQEEARIMLMSGNENMKRGAEFIMALTQMDEKVLREGQTDVDRVSPLLAKQQEVETQINLARSVLEGIAVNAMDNEYARNSMESTLSLMGNAAEKGADMTQTLLGGILTKISYGIDLIVRAINGVFNAVTRLSFFKGDKEDLTPEGEQRSRILDMVQSTSPTLDKDVVVAAVADAIGMNATTDVHGNTRIRNSLFSSKSKAMQTHANELIDAIDSGDTDAVRTFTDIVSSLSEKDSAIYTQVLEQRMKADNDLQQRVLQQIEGRPTVRVPSVEKTTVTESPVQQEVSNVEHSIEKKSTIAQATVVPNDIQVKEKESSVQQEVDKANLEIARREMEVEEEKRKLEMEKQVIAEQNVKVPESTTMPESPSVNVAVSENPQLLAAINSFNSKLDDLIRLQKEFNSNMTIQIIRG